MRLWNKKKTIGRKDLADFPEIDLEDVSVKIDTGAYTSSIHCHSIEEVASGSKSFLKVDFLDPSHHLYQEKVVVFDEFEKKVVKNSFGQDEERYVIKTDIVLFKKRFEIELTLTDRSDMKHPILLGRKVLADNFVVDVSRTNLSSKNKAKENR